jgi:hypothetical protein
VVSVWLGAETEKPQPAAPGAPTTE